MMEKVDVQFLIEMFVCVNSVDKRTEWRSNKDNLMRIVDLHNKYGTDAVDAKTQQIKELFHGV
jgi:hypothetical protein